MATFNQLPSYKQLLELAKQPFDLAKDGNLTPERIAQFSTESCGFKCLYATQRITEKTLQALAQLANEAHVIEKMHKMQSGEIMNSIEGFPSENRPVLHTAMRDFFDSPNSSPNAAKATALAKKEHEKLKKFVAEIDKAKFTDIVTIAIGGSDLGPRSVFLALQAYQKPGMTFHPIGNIDPDDTAAVFKKVKLEKTLVLVVSKSGTTLETVTNEAFARSFFEKANLNSKDHFVAVTGEGSPMDDKTKYRECFYMWDFVGGRFSTSSMGGGVLLSLMLGYDNCLEFLRGASAMDKIALIDDYKRNLPLLMALLGIWNRNFLHLPTVSLVPYAQALFRFPAHIQQVDMESNGKHIDKQGKSVDFDTGPIIWGEPGTCAQHSFYQLIHQGTSIVPMELIGFKECQEQLDLKVNNTTGQEKLLSNLFAQAIALATGKKSDNPNKEFLGNRPSTILLGKRLTPFSMGALFALYEHKVAFQGFIWNINSFDQEGVQLGKVLADKIIHCFEKKGEKYPAGEAYLKHLESI